MSVDVKERTQAYIHARHQHPAWQLLASHRAPLVLSCLEHLLSGAKEGVRFEDALQSLAGLLSEHANETEFEIEHADFLAQSRKELRSWIKRDLIHEREGYIYATDALESALRFINGLNNRILTSTGSRLSLVQGGIETLEERLNPDPKYRTLTVQRKIEDLQQELKNIEAGQFKVLNDEDAIEGIRNIYALTIDLKADFRRVEESWRKQGLSLRQSVVNAHHNRGEVVDQLLAGNQQLLDTPEGRAFQGFYAQLHRQVELQNMRERLRTILAHPAARLALTDQQHDELRWLVGSLVRESQAVNRARRSIERDVRGYLRSGLAAEHHRVGALLNELYAAAFQLEWTRDQRKASSPLPPIAFPVAGLTLVQRLRFTVPSAQDVDDLDFNRQHADLRSLPEEFWAGFDSLDRPGLVDRTREILAQQGRPMSIGELANMVGPQHDLEAIALWVSLGLVTEAPMDSKTDSFVLGTEDGPVRYSVPNIEFTPGALANFAGEI
jgi:hypothetical protein